MSNEMSYEDRFAELGASRLRLETELARVVRENAHLHERLKEMQARSTEQLEEARALRRELAARPPSPRAPEMAAFALASLLSDVPAHWAATGCTDWTSPIRYACGDDFADDAKVWLASAGVDPAANGAMKVGAWHRERDRIRSETERAAKAKAEKCPTCRGMGAVPAHPASGYKWTGCPTCQPRSDPWEKLPHG